ncbi:hypothetical protein [Cetobacterium sp. ZOR0034]|uniref:hypothetical protein n=1 Tax=Cetobacterium sp. ZOR0034 TaxID=1339239 RepID=UPI000647A8B5|nr:hypothetical protein [Cetobacterium sp. ZOR0034]
MSLYLGKIHYWLFNKILWFENLEESIVKFIVDRGLDVSVVNEEIEEKYGKKLENKNLEEIIDINNIHGWLQGRIHSSEGRMAAWINFILKNDENGIEHLKKIFEEQAILAAEEVKKERKPAVASDIYNCMNNYILDGMPCDRVNVISVSEDNLVQWERRVCVHKDVWAKENIDVKVFYDLRDFWIKTFVETLNSEFEYIKETDEKFKIVIK